ncbi:hypothetical protein NSS91_07530 [Caldifermentibacillus hisashii]|uniref:hypothetical protein n=1 Tax=Caldifermentibacillus hisashii TaxID=996558 RepID=UPI0031FD5A41
MDDKYAKAIVDELKKIRQELQKLNEPKVVGPLVFQQAQQQPEPEEETEEEQVIRQSFAGQRVSF